MNCGKHGTNCWQSGGAGVGVVVLWMVCCRARCVSLPVCLNAHKVALPVAPGGLIQCGGADLRDNGVDGVS